MWFVNLRSILTIQSGNVSDIVGADLLGIAPPFGKDFLFMEPGATIYQLFPTDLMLANLYFVYNVKGTKSFV